MRRLRTRKVSLSRKIELEYSEGPINYEAMYRVLGLVASSEKFVSLINAEARTITLNTQDLNTEIVLLGIHLSRFKRILDEYQANTKDRIRAVQGNLIRLDKNMGEVLEIMQETPLPFDINLITDLKEVVNDVSFEIPGPLPTQEVTAIDLHTVNLPHHDPTLNDSFKQVYNQCVQVVAAIERKSFRNQSKS